MSKNTPVFFLTSAITKSMTASGKSASSVTEQSVQSLFSLRFLTLTLSAPHGTCPKVRVTGTSDRVVVMDRSKYGDCATLSVAELAHLQKV
jgi:hypothetical protein